MATVVHETSHILAISSDLFRYYRNQDTNEPYTPRTSSGIPDNTPSSNTITTFTERGMNVNKLVLPKTLAQAKSHFECNSLNGVELEMQGSIGTAGSHLEKRIYFNDFMTGMIIPSVPVSYSRITLSLFEDSGWYRVNYTQATPLHYGKGKGCSFATEKCITGGKESASDTFCTKESSGCSPDGNHAIGMCSVPTYSDPLPTQYQYFSNPAQGGSISLMDYCPAYITFTSDTGASDCRFRANTPSVVKYSGETYGPSSRCVNSNLFSVAASGSYSSIQGRCVSFECVQTNGRTALNIQIAGEVIQCGTTGGQNMTSPNLLFGGYVTCPLVSSICRNTCKNQCMGWGNCVSNGTSNVCVCPPGYTGEDCSIVKATNITVLDEQLIMQESITATTSQPFTFTLLYALLLVLWWQ
jgi:hypothetical protein